MISFNLLIGGRLKYVWSEICMVYKQCHCLVVLVLGKIFGSRYFQVFLLFFSGKPILTFHANCLHWGEGVWVGGGEGCGLGGGGGGA